MSETYKVVYRADLSDGADEGPLWEPGCPLQIVVAQMSRNVGTAELYLQLRLRNVGARLINSCKMVVILTHDDGLEEREEIEKLDIDVLPGTTSDIPPLPLGSGTVASLSVRITELTAAGAAWATRIDPSPVPTKLSLELPERLLSARKRELDKIDASKSGLVLHGRVQNHVDYWICACGQANVGRTACCTCGFPKETLRGLESEDTLEQIARSFEEDEQERAEKHAASVKRLRKVAVAATALVVAGAVGFVIYAFYNSVIIPQQKYDEALSLIESGKYDEGVAELKELEGLGDSEQQIDLAKEDRYRQMFEYVTEHQDHDDQQTFDYLNELMVTKGQYYQKATDLYEKIYGWQLSVVVNNDEDDWTSSSGGSIAHIQIDNAPLFPNQSEVPITVNVQSPLDKNLSYTRGRDWGWSSDSTTLDFDVADGSINGQRATISIDPDLPANSRIVVTYERKEKCQVSLDD